MGGQGRTKTGLQWSMMEMLPDTSSVEKMKGRICKETGRQQSMHRSGLTVLEDRPIGQVDAGALISDDDDSSTQGDISAEPNITLSRVNWERDVQHRVRIIVRRRQMIQKRTETVK